jgi:hypothetical protein
MWNQTSPTSMKMTDENKDFEIKHGPLKGKKVALAPQDKVEGYRCELEEILEVIGHPEALITDLSTLSDFFTGDREASHVCMERIGQAFGIDVPEAAELLVDVATRVRKARKG